MWWIELFIELVYCSGQLVHFVAVGLDWIFLKSTVVLAVSIIWWLNGNPK